MWKNCLSKQFILAPLNPPKTYMFFHMQNALEITPRRYHIWQSDLFSRLAVESWCLWNRGWREKLVEYSWMIVLISNVLPLIASSFNLISSSRQSFKLYLLFICSIKSRTPCIKAVLTNKDRSARFEFIHRRRYFFLQICCIFKNRQNFGARWIGYVYRSPPRMEMLWIVTKSSILLEKWYSWKAVAFVYIYILNNEGHKPL